MKHEVGVSTNTYHGFSIDEAIEGIAAAGFRNIELTAVNGWTEHVHASMTENEISRIKKKLEDKNLNAFALSGHCNLFDDERLKDFVANINLAGKFGCDYIVSSAGEAHGGKESELSDIDLVNNIKKIIPECEKNNVKLVLEIHGEYGTGQKLKDVVDAVDSEWVGINYDTANVVFFGKKYPETDVKTCVQEVKYVHLKDKSGEMDEWNFPAPGKGSLKLLETISVLEENDYRGPLSVEIEFTENFTMNEKKDGDLSIVDAAVKDAYLFLVEHGLVK